MCEFVSYIEKNDHVYFLTRELIYNTPRGDIVRTQCSEDDMPGHGAIRLYFDLSQNEGRNIEITDFSSPNNFPDAIAKAIKNGEFRGLVPIPSKLLRKPLKDKYRADVKPLDDKYWNLFAIPENRTPAWK